MRLRVIGNGSIVYAPNALDEVSKAEKVLAAAHSSREAGALDDLISKDFVWIKPTGAVSGKREFIDDIRAGRSAAYDLEGDQEIRVFGTTVVVRGTRVVRGGRRDHKIMVTDIWVARDSRWQCVSSQSTDKK